MNNTGKDLLAKVGTRDNWIRCRKCNHKLMKMLSEGNGFTGQVLEMKCHSCKEFNLWDGVGNRTK